MERCYDPHVDAWPTHIDVDTDLDVCVNVHGAVCMQACMQLCMHGCVHVQILQDVLPLRCPTVEAKGNQKKAKVWVERAADEILAPTLGFPHHVRSATTRSDQRLLSLLLSRKFSKGRVESSAKRANRHEQENKDQQDTDCTVTPVPKES